MQIDKLPFNVSLLANDTSEIVGFIPIESLDIFATDGQFHPRGLYSSLAFGEVGTHERQTKFAYIDMRTEIMHPKVFRDLCKLKGLYEGIMSGRAYAEWDTKLKDFVPSNVLDGKTGYSFFIEHFIELIHATNDSSIRDLRIELLNKVKDKCMYRYFQVIPAALRDIEMDSKSRPKEDEINPLYRKLIRAANSISVHSRNLNDPALDTARWSLQSSAVTIYDTLETLFTGKRGWLLDKVSARNVSGGTRNVITGMDICPKKLGAKESITMDHTVCGLHQYLKGTSDKYIYDIRRGPMGPVIDFLPLMCRVVDTKTLTSKTITPTKFTVDNWGTEEGLEKLMNGFAKNDARHKPIYIDGNYAALIYRDGKVFKVFYDIEDLPRHLNRSHVTPITWAEMFYISVYKSAPKVGAYSTRYPIADLGSTYYSKIYLETTTISEKLIELDDNWLESKDEKFSAFHMPLKGQPFRDSASVHTNKLPGLNADMDGDKV